jgi:hypothetical protein
MRFKTPDVLPHFNAALNACKGEMSEEELAARLGTKARTLGHYRRGRLPKGLRGLLNCPEALHGLILDFQNQQNTTTDTQNPTT